MNPCFFDIVDKAAQAIMPFLLKEILYSVLLFIVIYVLTIIFRNRSPRWHLGLWALVLFRLVLPLDLSHSYSGRSLLNRLHADRVCVWITGFLDTFNSGSNSQSDFHSSFSSGDSTNNPNHSRISDSSKEKSRLWQMIGLFIWLLGMIIFSWVYSKQLINYHRLVKHASPVRDSAATKILQSWRTRFRIRRPIRLVSSVHNLSPFTVGIFRPVIYLPHRVLETNNMGLLQSIIAHETAHIKRFDDLWIKFQNLIQIIYFFHPVVWIVNSKMGLARECISDSMVLAERKISPNTYGQGILTILKLNLFGTESIGLLPEFGNQRKKLMFRIKNLKGGRIMRTYHFILGYAALIILGFILLPMGGSDAQSPKKERNTQVQTVPPNQQKSIEFVLPLQVGRVTARFGPMKNPFTAKVVHHRGIDIAAETGTEVYAAAGGMVLSAISDDKNNKGPGKKIVLQHTDVYQTQYTHLDTIYVEKGQQVEAGDLIAGVGTTGLSTGPHLHFEIRVNGEAQDPEKYIDFKKLKPPIK